MNCPNPDCELTVVDNQTSFSPDEVMICKICGSILEENKPLS